MSGDEISPFWKAARFLDHAKQRAKVVAMLEAGYQPTADELLALAIGISRLGQDKVELMRKPTKKNRGRKRDDGPWSFRRAVRDVREFAAAAGCLQREILDQVAIFWAMHGQNFDRYRARVIEELSIAKASPETPSEIMALLHKVSEKERFVKVVVFLQRQFERLEKPEAPQGK